MSEETIKFVRHRKVDNHELYIYKRPSGAYILQEETLENGKRVAGRFVAGERELDHILLIYEDVIDKYKP